MIEQKAPEVNVDEIMRNIKAEVALRKASLPFTSADDLSHQVHLTTPLGSRKDQTITWGFIKKVQSRLRNYKIYDFMYRYAVRFKNLVPKYREHIPLGDLMQYHDQEFLRTIYRTILKREVDTHGMGHYLPLLRSGRMSKSEIIGRLRYSKEGREKGVKIKGLFLRFIARTAFRIPVIGHIGNMVVSAVRLPKAFIYIQQLESTVDQNVHHLGKQLSDIARVQSEQISETVKIQDNLTKVQNDITTVKNDIITVQRELLATMVKVQSELQGKIDDIGRTVALKADIQLADDMIQSLKTDLTQKMDEIGMDMYTVKSRINENRLNILEQQKNLSRYMTDAKDVKSDTAPHDQLERSAANEVPLYNSLYLSFEDRFRGTREEIKNRLNVYVPYVEQAITVARDPMILDIGCGRGEWLEVLRDRGIRSKGIDLNNLMIAQCRENGFDVSEADAIEYLRGQKTNSLSVITGFHLIEHLPLNTFIELIDESYRALAPSGVVIFETPNPENLIVGACNFYIDPTHIRPIPPVTAQFIMESRGFLRNEIKRLHPNVINYQGELNAIVDFFRKEQDYSIIAYKPEANNR